MFLIEMINNKYRITENDSLINIFEDKIEKYYLNSILDRIKDYLREVK